MVSKSFIKSLAVGSLIGAGVGILYAPKSGKETREQILSSAQEVLEKAKSQYDEVSGKLVEMKTQKEEIIMEKKDRMKKALSAGISAYKEVNRSLNV